MHTTSVRDHSEEAAPFATATIKLGEDNHITTSMSVNGMSDITLFFNSSAEIREFATRLLVQASEEF